MQQIVIKIVQLIVQASTLL